MPTTTSILESIEARLDALRGEIETLNSARAELVRETPRPKQRPPARSKPATASRRGRRARPDTKRPLDADALVPLLEQSDGLSTPALARRINASRDRTLTLLREAEAAGRVRRSGERRATRWHAITDEDRIRERASQLAAQSRSRR